MDLRGPRSRKAGSRLWIISMLICLFCTKGQAAINIIKVTENPICGSLVNLRCESDTALTSGDDPVWFKNAVQITVTGKFSETRELSQRYAVLHISSYTTEDDGTYTCGFGFINSVSSVQVNCTKPTKPECDCEECGLILVIISGICAGINVIMWVICWWLQYKKEECCQIWCCIWLIVHGFFVVIAWILWGISYWQWQCEKEDCCQCCHKAGFIVPIVLDFCAAIAGIIWGIFCCLQYTGKIHCLPPCCGFSVCFDCEEKEESDFITYTEQELRWMDKMIADTKQVGNSDDDTSTKLTESKKKEKDVEKRLKTWKKRCAAEEKKISEDNRNERKIRDCIKKLQDKMEEWKTAKKLKGTTVV